MTQTLKDKIMINRMDYGTTRIHKRSGGTRLIYCLYRNKKHKYEPLMKKLQLLHVDKNAVGYRKGIGTRDVAHKHGRHNWFYKFDFKNFFPSFSAEMVLNHFKDLTEDEQALLLWIRHSEDAPKLQQGNPLSPVATNIMMAKFDREFYKELKKLFKVPVTYSRYADDILVSSYQRLDFKKISKLMRRILNKNNLNNIKLNQKKSRELQKGQKVFFLGIAINKESTYGIGHVQRKKIIKLYKNIINKTPTMHTSTVRRVYHQVVYINSISKNKIDIDKLSNRKVYATYGGDKFTVKELVIRRGISTRVTMGEGA